MRVKARITILDGEFPKGRVERGETVTVSKEKGDHWIAKGKADAVPEPVKRERTKAPKKTSGAKPNAAPVAVTGAAAGSEPALSAAAGASNA